MTKRYFNTLIFLSVFGGIVTAKHQEVVFDDTQKYDLGTSSATTASDDDGEWWKNAVIYQIYPSSFMDSNGDGKGDLNGITSKLEHLKDAGVTATWLSPIFQSPNVDQGYDISDYKNIDSGYGSMADFENLVKTAKKLGIRIILDFVPNHTSDEHEWFIKSENNSTGYENYYIWVDQPKEGQRLNNWISAFRGSAWKWSGKRQQYYYHAFHEKQPDLNYRDSNVVKAMKDTLTFWMDKGIDGFRIDAVPFLFESKELQDEPVAPGRTYDVNDDGTLSHIYTQNLEETYDMVYQWRQHIDEYVKAKNKEKKLMMTEVYASIDQTMRYYGSNDGTKLGAHFPFNFNFISQLKKGFSVEDVVYAIHKWLDKLPKQHLSNWVLGNHDNHRVGSRLGEKNMDAFNMITAFLPGVMITYYGEEIGMLDGQVACKDGHDTQAKADNCAKFNETSRDFERTPMQWDDSANAGFSNASKIWLPVADNYKTVNVAKEYATSGSHYNLFKDLVQFRKRFQKKSDHDDVVAAKASDNVLEILRQRDEGEYVLLFNIGDKEEKFKFIRSMQKYEVVLSSHKEGNLKEGSLVTDVVQLQPHQSVILVQSDKNMATKSLCSIAIVFICVILNIYF